MWTRYAPCMIRVKVKTPKPTKIKLVAKDKNQANTEFTNTTKTINGEQDMFIRMPLSPNVLCISITNVAVGERPRAEETTFEVLVYMALNGLKDSSKSDGKIFGFPKSVLIITGVLIVGAIVYTQVIKNRQK